MKLLYSITSPFARKVRVFLAEAGLSDRVSVESVSAVPTAPAPAFAANNPLAKIPTLVLASGEALYDSRVIVEFLDSMHTGEPLFPAPGPARWTALRRQALADGAMDAAILVRYEGFIRPKELAWPDWVEGQMNKIRRALDALEGEADSMIGKLTIGEITVACLLDYLDFRYPAENWRNTRPKLAAFQAEFSARPSMVETRPS
jgi:glutathione S-transferase